MAYPDDAIPDGHFTGQSNITREKGDGNDLASLLNTIVGKLVGVGAYKVARGMATTVTASDTVVTGLATCVAVVATLNDDPVDGCQFVTANIGDQAGSPAAGSFYLKTWKATDGDATLVAATTFTKKVAWIAIGT